MKISRQVRGDYIHGEFFKTSDANGKIESINPGNLDEAPVLYPYCYEHANESVGAARQAFSSWKRLPYSDRASTVSRFRDLLEKKSEQVAIAISTEVGKPLWESRWEVKTCLSVIDLFLKSDLAPEQKLAEVEADAEGRIRFAPRGVMAVITHPTAPLSAVHSQFIPSLLHGNTVVIKSSKHSPGVGQQLAEIFHEAGMPPGVVNVIHGDSEVARRLISHSDVAGIFYTGSFETGIKIRKQLATDYWKVLVLDMGGKNSALIWDDCHYERALHEVIYSSFLSSGQRSESAHQILVHEKIFDKFTSDLHQLSKKCKIGYGFDEKDTPFMGPLITESAMENYLRYQGIAVREGCEEIMRGKSLEKEKRGFYVSPSIHWVKKPDAKSIYQKSEIFGPNIALYKVSDLEEATDIINQSQYGLVSSIYTQNKKNFQRVFEDIQSSLIYWNRPTVEVSYHLPYGGLKKSGNARPMGLYSAMQCSYPVASLIDSEKRKSPWTLQQLPHPLPKKEGT